MLRDLGKGRLFILLGMLVQLAQLLTHGSATWLCQFEQVNELAITIRDLLVSLPFPIPLTCFCDFINELILADVVRTVHLRQSEITGH
jgi:hypothetical protein